MKEPDCTSRLTHSRIVSVRRAAVPGYSIMYILYRTKRKSGGASYSLTVTISSGTETASASAADISRSRERADEIFNAAADGKVTPCALKDVLEELL